jgi:hypothetical protein
VSALEPALAGRPLDRPLLAPRFAALAAEVEELPLEAFLADLGRRARIYADLARSLRVDVLFVNDADEEPDVLADLLQRVRATVPTPLGAVVTGPATRGDMPSVLAAARAVAEAGAEVVLVRETVPLGDNYPRLSNPLWGSLKFFRAVGVLLAPNPPAAPGPYLPCLTVAADVPHALAVAPGEASAAGRATALITHTEDHAGHVPVRELQAAADRR